MTSNGIWTVERDSLLAGENRGPSRSGVVVVVLNLRVP